MNKKINANLCFLSVIGPGGCGKTQLVSRILLNQKIMFKPCFEKILYFYKHFQTEYESLLLGCTRPKVSIEFHQGLQWTAVDRIEAEKLKTLVVIDDLYQVACEDERFLNLVVAGRHRNIHLMTLRHNIYQPAKKSKTIDLNVTEIVFFENLGDN